MGKFVAGLVVASAALVSAWWFALRPAERGPCDDRCGPGTACVDDLCEIEEAAPEAPAEAGKPEGKRRRGKRRGSRGSGARAAGGDEVDAEAGDAAAVAPPPRVNDSHIPEFSNAAQTIDLNAGSERLTDTVVRGEMRSLTPRFQRCIADVSAAYPDVRGSVKIKARVLGSGKVESVTATAPASIRESGAIPCIRKAVYDHRFPSFDGPGSAIDLQFDVD